MESETSTTPSPAVPDPLVEWSFAAPLLAGDCLDCSFDWFLEVGRKSRDVPVGPRGRTHAISVLHQESRDGIRCGFVGFKFEFFSHRFLLCFSDGGLVPTIACVERRDAD